ncbi:MAG: Stealth CR1 domain-containing protein [Sandarakinorhabdus sp.]|nr:Stealth CR1 domain-containing protein [Sandarakinorhabdus sp.]
MPIDHSPAASRIAAVITWVDGADPVHRAKRETFMARSVPANENGINPHRWACSNELGYCLRSIANNAPWIGRIWIVTDAQTPDLSGLPAALRNRITIIDHQLLFRDHPDALPTFNSLAIESLLWRIPGLAERFVYFNDDVFLTALLHPDDVFRGAAPVLRGKWVDHAALATNPDRHTDPALFHHNAQINAAALIGIAPDRLFASAHVVHPLRRSVMAQLWSDHRAAFVANIHHRFRDPAQFLPQGLHNHACITAGIAVIETADDHLHLRTGAIADYPLADVGAYLRRALDPAMKFLCINDMPQLEAAIPDMRDWIERAIAPQRRAA